MRFFLLTFAVALVFAIILGKPALNIGSLTGALENVVGDVGDVVVEAVDVTTGAAEDLINVVTVTLGDTTSLPSEVLGGTTNFVTVTLGDLTDATG
uniref:Secreted protein n=1 Tax=Lutzomyia longipalpis TaxID=7200 RepID=A0A1B0CNR1_LUTLO